jgi:Sulfotransferase family
VNPYVFVVGCPRSGTTLLQRMLDAHPQLAVANDTHFIPRPLRHLPDGADPRITEQLVHSVVSYRRFPRLGLAEDVAYAAAEGAGTYAAFVTRLYDRFAATHGKPLAGEKTPDYVRHFPKLTRLFPHARFVHVVRDGRDVALSVREWAQPDKGPGKFALWADEPIAVCALWWRWLVSSGRRDGADLGPARYHELRYERLVDAPAETLRSVSAFLDLPFAPEMLAFHEGRRRAEPGLSAKQAWLPPTAGLRNWRRELPIRELELFEALAGDLLEELGYERAVASVSAETAELAARARSWWTAELKRRQERQRAGAVQP